MRQSPSNTLEKWLGAIPDQLAKSIHPNHVLADLVLTWMLSAIKTHDGGNLLIPNIQQHIWTVNGRIVKPSHPQPLGPTGSGDVYGNVLEYAPAGGIWSPLVSVGSRVTGVFNRIAPNLGDNIQDLLGVKTLLRIVTATRDRRVPGGRIPGGQGDVFDYKKAVELEVGEGEHRSVNIGVNGRVDAKRYPSKTFEGWQLWRNVFGRYPL